MTRVGIVCVLLAILIFSAGCASNTNRISTQPSISPSPTFASAIPSSEAESTHELDGSQWKLIFLNDSPPVANSYISLYIRKGTIWGSAGINIYGAKYSLEDPDILVFTDGAMTDMGGPENIARQEQAYVKFLRGPGPSDKTGAASYQFYDNHLKIYNVSNQISLVFEKIPEYPMNPDELVGTKWQLVSLNDEPVLEGLSITLSFNSDSHASGIAGGYYYNLPYVASGDDIRWGISSGRIGDLPRELELQASHYTGTIIWAANYRLSKDKLEIFTAKGDVLVYKPLINFAK